MLSLKKLILFGVAIEAVVTLSACVSSTSATMAGMAASDTQNAEQQSTMLARYRQAEQRLPVNLLGAINNLYLTPNWLDDGGFWYSLQETSPASEPEANTLAEAKNRVRYYRFHPETGVKPLFDEEKLATALALSHPENGLAEVTVNRVEGDNLQIRIDDNDWQCVLEAAYQCTHVADTKPKESPHLAAGFLSPDGEWRIAVRNYNLVLVHVASGQEKQLTQDGSAENAYATDSPSPKTFFNKAPGSVAAQQTGYWSPDSRYFVTFQLDLRATGTLHLQQSVTGKGLRPRLYQYHYPMAGDDQLIQGQLVAVKVNAEPKQPEQSEKQAQPDFIQNASVHRIDTPELLQTYYGDPLWGSFASNNKYYFVERERGFHRFHLKELSPDTGKVRTLITETNDKFIDPWVQRFRVLPDQDVLFWTSERNGIQQVFLYNLNANADSEASTNTEQAATLVNAVTPAHLFMRAIKGIDAKKSHLYFEGSGINANSTDSDPYFRYLYRVDFNGANLHLLTPEAVMHNTYVSPDFATFTDTYSTVDTVPEHVLRSTESGQILARLHQVNNRTLLAKTGYKPPQPFKVMAQDGTTPLHGILYFPSDFDAKKSYPVIDDIYTGPHNYFTPKTYDGPLYAHASALAELGFIVLKMDGRGTGKRDRVFHEYSYNNLAGGADDHVWALRKLAESRPYLDLDRVGIYGFSAGGYDTVRAMYKYPDFFKVGVAASGNHDFRVDKAGWNETWMGYPVAEHWDQQSNLTGAEKLQGALFLAHGELDDNVHPAATLQLVDKLIKANKDFDFLLYPNMGHVLHYHPHFVRTRWDFFVKHLLGDTPPKNYQISSMPTPTQY